jgi:hypothetical protein
LIHGDDHPWQDRLFPVFLGRNLNVALKNETLDRTQVNDALNPFWLTIWHIVAAKHWHEFQAPLEITGPEGWPGDGHAKPLKANGLSVIASTSQGNIEIQIDLIDRSLGLHLRQYPEIEELQRALSSTRERVEGDYTLTRLWDGPAFQVGVLWRDQTDEVVEIILQISKANMSISFTDSEWRTLRKLLAQSLNKIDISTRIEALKLSYGSCF